MQLREIIVLQTALFLFSVLIIYLVEYARQCGYGDAVVGNRYSGLLGRREATHNVATREHAGSAVYDKVVGRQVGRKVGAPHDVDM